jgi:hypothetical protein
VHLLVIEMFSHHHLMRPVGGLGPKVNFGVTLTRCRRHPAGQAQAQTPTQMGDLRPYPSGPALSHDDVVPSDHFAKGSVEHLDQVRLERIGASCW